MVINDSKSDFDLIILQQIRIEFNDFELETCGAGCACDYLELYDGWNASAPVIDRFCGQSAESRISSAQYLYLRFRADAQGNQRGFNLTHSRKFVNLTHSRKFINLTHSRKFVNLTHSRKFINLTHSRKFVNLNHSRKFINLTHSRKFVNLIHSIKFINLT